MELSKEKLSNILNDLKIPVADSMFNKEFENKIPRVVYWDFLWEPNNASGLSTSTIVTYQVSFISKTPRNPKLMELLQKLNEIGITPVVSHEHDIETRTVHSAFAIQVIENVL